jgi:hypothetical protein
VDQVDGAVGAAPADDGEVALAVAVEVADARDAGAEAVVGRGAEEGGVGVCRREHRAGDGDVVHVPAFEGVGRPVGDELELEADVGVADVGAEVEGGVGPAGRGVDEVPGAGDVAAVDQDAVGGAGVEELEPVADLERGELPVVDGNHDAGAVEQG